MCAKLKETVLPNGITVFCLRKEEVPLVYQQVQEYLKHGIELNRGDTVFDVGANIGLFSLYLYKKLHSDSNIYAFEPIPVLYEVLRQNAECLDTEQLKVFPLDSRMSIDLSCLTIIPMLVRSRQLTQKILFESGINLNKQFSAISTIPLRHEN